MSDSKLHNAVVLAQEKFWESLAASYPEIKTGDFPPDATLAFDGACMSAAAVWVSGNQSFSSEEQEKIWFLNNLGHEVYMCKGQVGLWVWWARHSDEERKFGSVQEAIGAALVAVMGPVAEDAYEAALARWSERIRGGQSPEFLIESTDIFDALSGRGMKCSEMSEQAVEAVLVSHGLYVRATDVYRAHLVNRSRADDALQASRNI